MRGYFTPCPAAHLCPLDFQLQTRTASRSVSDIGGQGGADRESGAGAEVELAVREAGRGGNGTLYKLAGMSEDERQQMLDLREEVGKGGNGEHARQARPAETCRALSQHKHDQRGTTRMFIAGAMHYLLMCSTFVGCWDVVKLFGEVVVYPALQLVTRATGECVLLGQAAFFATTSRITAATRIPTNYYKFRKKKELSYFRAASHSPLFSLCPKNRQPISFVFVAFGIYNTKTPLGDLRHQ